jgi:hypothetical protein
LLLFLLLFSARERERSDLGWLDGGVSSENYAYNHLGQMTQVQQVINGGHQLSELNRMVNREKRDLARRLIEKLLACEITNDEFSEHYPSPEKNDQAVGAIYDALWGFWDDRHTHKLEGKYSLDPKARALFARCIAFLDSELEYEFPAIQRTRLSLGILRMLGLKKVADKKADEWTQKMNRFGKLEVWPFIREEDLTRKRVVPPLTHTERGPR